MAFVWDMASGVLMGGLYDLFRAVRRRSPYPWVNILCDVLYWFLCAGLTLLVLFFTASMKLRGYAFLGIVWGVLLYAWCLSAPLAPFYQKIADILGFFLKILFTIGKFFVIIVKSSVLFLGRPLVWLWRGLLFLAAWLGRIGKQHRKLIKRI